jgi:hypothetical protein
MVLAFIYAAIFSLTAFGSKHKKTFLIFELALDKIEGVSLYTGSP